MATRHLSIYVENGAKIEEDLERAKIDSLKTAREWVEQLSDRAFGSILRDTPVKTGRTILKLHKSGAKYHPGGAGGGGTWEAQVGFLRGGKNEILYVHKGTAQDKPLNRIYPSGSREKNVYTIATRKSRLRLDNPTSFGDKINPPAPIGNRRALTFQKLGEPRRFRAWVSGQEPNPFVYFAYKQVSLYAGFTIERLPRRIFPSLANPR